MTEPRVVSVAGGAVVVTDDPDGLIGALIGALLDEPGAARALVHGTAEALALAGLQVQRFRSAIDLVHTTGAPVWTLSREGATAAIRGDAIERLIDQAHEHRRAVEIAAFPIGGRLGHGRYVITERLRGGPDRGMYRAREAGSPSSPSYLVTMGPPQQRGFAELRTELALVVPGVAALDYIGRLEPHSEAGHEAMLEVEPAGVPAAQLRLPLPPATAVALTVELAGTVAAAHASGLAIGGLRPELIYVQSMAAPALTAVAPRAERFWTTAERRSYGVAPCFDQFFLAPEQLAQPLGPPPASADVFSLGALLAYWLTGEHPFEGEGTSQAMAIAIGRRRASRLQARFEAIVAAALTAEPASRISLGELVAQLARLQ